MNIVLIGLSALAAYLLGSVSFAIWYGKTFYGIDVREHGSGNAGATNTFRVLGKKPGGIVFMLDVIKGYVASSFAVLLYIFGIIQADYMVYAKIAFGMIAVVGHIFPLYHNFKGGKGVAALLGMGLCLQPVASATSLLTFFIILSVTHYVSLGSMLSALMFPLICYQQGESPTLIGLGLIVFGLLVYTHRANIKRLFAGIENKTYLFKKKEVKSEKL